MPVIICTLGKIGDSATNNRMFIQREEQKIETLLIAVFCHNYVFSFLVSFKIIVAADGFICPVKSMKLFKN